MILDVYYPILLKRNARDYTITVPDLPSLGSITGISMEDTKRMAQYAVYQYIHHRISEGKYLPEPSDIRNYLHIRGTIASLAGDSFRLNEETYNEVLRLRQERADALARAKQERIEQQIRMVDRYIDNQPESLQPTLNALRKLAKETLIVYEEDLVKDKPALYSCGHLLQYAGSRNNVILYPGKAVIEQFKKRLEEEGISHSASSIRFSANKPLPTSLIRAILLKFQLG